MNKVKAELAQRTNPAAAPVALIEAIKGADVFLGASGGVVPEEFIASMAPGAIVFALANPDPEIHPELAAKHAAVVATGRSDFPNQINNVLAFPGVFRGALDAGARRITEGMKRGRCRGDLRRGRATTWRPTGSCRARWTRGSPPPLPTRSRRRPAPEQVMVRRLALALVALIAMSTAGCGGPPAAPSIAVGATPDAESALVAHLYAAALRSYGSPAHVQTEDDPLTELDAGEVMIVPGFTGRLLARFEPDATARSAAQVYRTMVSALPEGVAAGDYTTSAEDKPALAVTEATAERVGRAGCDGRCPPLRPVKVGRVAGVPSAGGHRDVQGADAWISRQRNAIRRTAGGGDQRRVDVDRGAQHSRPSCGAVRSHVVDPRRERGSAVPAQRADRIAGAGDQRGGRCAGHRRAGARCAQRSTTVPNPAWWPTASVGRLRPLRRLVRVGHHSRHDRREQPLIARAGGANDEIEHLASGPTSTRALFLRTRVEDDPAAFCGDVDANFLSKVCASSSLSRPSTVSMLRAIAVLMPPGCTHRHLDRMARQRHLLPQRLGESADRELGRVVGGLAGHREQPEDARHVDDVPVAGRDQVRQERLGAVDDAPEVDVHHPLDVLELADLDVAGERDAGVVVDLVDRAEVRADRVGVDAERLTLGDVEPVGLDRRADGLQPLLGGREALGVDVADRQLGARAASSIASACRCPTQRRSPRPSRHVLLPPDSRTRGTTRRATYGVPATSPLQRSSATTVPPRR